MSNRAAKHLDSIQPGTLFTGVDLGLDDLVVVLNPAAKHLDRFRSDNNAAGYANFRHRAQRGVEKLHAPSFLIGMEPTNYYWKQFGYDLKQHHLPFHLVNPLTVKRHRADDQLDRSKDDWHNAFTIADLLRPGKFTGTRLPHGVCAELQTGYIAYQRLRRDRGRQTTLPVNTVRQLFPEFDQVIKDVSSATAAAIIEASLLPHVISTCSEDLFLACT